MRCDDNFFLETNMFKNWSCNPKFLAGAWCAHKGTHSKKKFPIFMNFLPTQMFWPEMAENEKTILDFTFNTIIYKSPKFFVKNMIGAYRHNFWQNFNEFTPFFPIFCKNLLQTQMFWPEMAGNKRNIFWLYFQYYYIQITHKFCLKHDWHPLASFWAKVWIKFQRIYPFFSYFPRISFKPKCFGRKWPEIQEKCLEYYFMHNVFKNP